MEIQVGHLLFESGAMPAIAGDDQAPGKITEGVEGIEGDLDALGWNETGRKEQEPGFLGIGDVGRDRGVELDKIDPPGVVPIFQKPVHHEAGSDLDAEVGMVADPGEAIGAGPSSCIAHG